MSLPNGWKKVKLGDVATISSGSTPLRSNKAYFENGNMPWVKTMDLTNGKITKTDECITELAAKKCKPYPVGTVLVAMYGGFNQIGRTGLLTFPASINQALAALQFDKDICSEYVLFYLNANVDRWRSCAASSRKDPNITSHDVEKFKIVLPPLEEQKKIAATLSVWDSAIDKMEKLIEAKENSYACFLASSIKTNAYVELGVFLTEVSERNKDEKIQQVLSVSNSRGFILPEEQFDRKVASENLSNYKIVRLGQYAYNPSRINVGSIARLNDWNEAVISPMYTVFEIVNQEELDSDFLLHWLNSSEAKQRIKNSAQGSVRETVGFGDLCKIKIPRFDLKKQQKIVSVLNAMDEEISLLRQQLENYKKQKQGLMQKLLTGQWRVK